jgi:hypothetical protein
MSEHNERRDYEREQAARTEALRGWYAAERMKMIALYANLPDEELRKRLAMADEIGYDPRAPEYLIATSLIGGSLIRAELTRRHGKVAA